MSRRGLGQYSLADALVSRKAKGSEWLEDLEKMIQWPLIDALLSKIHASAEGAPGYPPLAMLKILLLQQWYCLSDEAIEAAVDDRLSFRRFCGLPLDTAAPDHSTIWRFRELLARGGLAETIFEAVNAQIEARGLLVKRGTLIDASIIPAAVKPPRGDTGELSERDPEAGWTRKNDQSTYGYKVHAAIDEESGIVRRAVTTSADLGDALMVPELVMGDEDAVYADKGYDGKAQRAFIAAAGAKDRIMGRAKPGKPMPSWQKWLNRCIGAVRSSVERGFAVMKGPYGLRRMRYLGLARNGTHVHLIAAAMNLRRMRVLVQRQERCA
jgi:transposase, IS5 family